MKILWCALLFVGMAKQCTKVDHAARLDAIAHPDLIHKMELILADDLNSDDSTTAHWASEFIRGFEADFRSYTPDFRTISKLRGYSPGLAIKVIGGNWCSDTRREVPRLCKILHYMNVPADSFAYFRVDENKNAVADDFAASWEKGPVPDFVIYFQGKIKGHIREIPRKTLEADLLKILRN